MTTTTADDTYELARKIIGIGDEIHSTQVLLHNASQIGDARGVGRLQDALDRKVRVRRSWMRRMIEIQGEGNAEEYVQAVREMMD